MATAYVLLCDVEDMDVETGTCAAPYYGPLPSFIPDLPIDDGVLIGFAIGGVWCIGLVARLLIRAGQQEYQRS